MEFLIVTGLSGSGKSKAINALEDIGFYCVDNIPSILISKFYQLCMQAQSGISRFAIVTDTRGGTEFDGFLEELSILEENNYEYKILFIDCSDSVLVNRFKETRRKHPLSVKNNGFVQKAIEQEREILAPVREKADFLIDTTHLSSAQLKEKINSLFLNDISQGLAILCVSFGFKNGIPSDSDLVFDVRCLPNPYYVETLKRKTGLNQEVSTYVLKCEQTKLFLEKLYDMVDFMVPLYYKEGKSQLIISIGCTGGKHRSVTIAECLSKHLSEKGMPAGVSHRDINKE